MVSYLGTSFSSEVGAADHLGRQQHCLSMVGLQNHMIKHSCQICCDLRYFSATELNKLTFRVKKIENIVHVYII